METPKFEYCVAIRTVGKAGDKYIQELQSLHRQTVKPKHIFVHLAEGFERPKEQVGMEEYIITPKGLVHQRAASLDGVDTEFLLILDDDVFFPDDAVEKLHQALIEHEADCIAPDTFPNHEMSFKGKLTAYMANSVKPRRDDEWAIKIERNGTFSYNNYPQKNGVYPTQSAAGPAYLVKTEVFRAIHYEDELFVDEFPPGTYGEDQLNFNKMYRNGYKVLLQYDAGIIHLDAGTNNVKQKTYEKLYYRAMSQYITWYRSCYDLRGNTKREKFRCKWAYGCRFTLGAITRIGYSIVTLSTKFITAHVKGNIAARKYVKSDRYKSVPNFILK